MRITLRYAPCAPLQTESVSLSSHSLPSPIPGETEPKLGSIDLLEYYNLRKIANFVLDQFNPRSFPPSLALDPKGQLYVKVEGETRIRQLQGTDVGLAKYGSQAAARPKPLTEAQIKPFTKEALDRLASSVSAGPMELPEEGRGALVEAPGEAQVRGCSVSMFWFVDWFG